MFASVSTKSAWLVSVLAVAMITGLSGHTGKRASVTDQAGELCS